MRLAAALASLLLLTACPGGPCGPGSCNGCCKDDRCERGDQSSACGRNGNNCTQCSAGVSCSAGVCGGSSTGGGRGGGAGGGAAGGSGGGVAGSSGGGSGGGSAGGGSVASGWENLGAFGNQPANTDSIEGLDLLQTNNRIHIAYRQTSGPAFFNRTGNPIAATWNPGWVNTVVSAAAPAAPVLFSGPMNAVFVNVCRAGGGDLVKLPVAAMVSVQPYTPCLQPMAAGPALDLFYGLNLAPTVVQIARSTNGGMTWTAYTSGIPTTTQPDRARLFVKQTGNLVVSFVTSGQLQFYETGGMTWVPLGGSFGLPTGATYDAILDRSGRPCFVYANAGNLTVVQCYEAGAWLQQGGSAFTASVPTRFSLAVDSTNKFWLALVASEGIVLSLEGNSWTRKGGCFGTGGCPDAGLAEIALGLGPSDEPFVATTSSAVDDQPTLWRLP